MDKMLEYINNHWGSKNSKIYGCLLPLMITIMLKICFIIIPITTSFLLILADFDKIAYCLTTIVTLIIITKYKFDFKGIAFFRSFILTLFIWVSVFLLPVFFMLISILEVLFIYIWVPLLAFYVFKFVKKTKYMFLKKYILDIKNVLVASLVFITIDVLYFAVFKLSYNTDVIFAIFWLAGGFSGFYIVFLILNLIDYFKTKS